jgi:hypothetical protein
MNKNFNMSIIKNFKLFESDGQEKWAIYAGLGGGFGGAQFHEVFTGTREWAEKVAYQAACEDYEQYEGMYGLRSVSDIMEEDEVDEDDAESTYQEEKEGWLDYYVEPYDPNNPEHN